MPVICSGNLYNMSNIHIPNNSNHERANLQQQITHITTILEQLFHQLDVMDKCWAWEGLRSSNRKWHGQFHKDSLDENNMDDKENLEDEDIREFVNY